jgi:NADPH:quinone reductase-like Zn-dependent oxidoreductase
MNHALLSTMCAVQLDQPNGNLTFREIPMPRPKADRVLIRMAAAEALVATTSG